MSLVLGYTDGKTAIISSDGRAGINGCVSEEYDKTRRINKNIILGFVGLKERSEHFINCAYLEMGDNVENYYIDDFMEIVEYGMSLDATREKLQSTFIIIGKTPTDEIKFAIVGQDTNYEIKYIPTDKANVAFIGGTIPIPQIREICERNFTADTKIMNMVINTIREVSKLDTSVNTNCFFTFL